MHIFEVHSNGSACRKSGRLGLDQAIYATYAVAKYLDTATVNTSTKFNKITFPSDVICTKDYASTSDECWDKLKTDKMDRRTHMQSFGVARTCDRHSLGQWMHRHLPVTYSNHIYCT